MDEKPTIPPENNCVEGIRKDLAKVAPTPGKRAMEKFALAAIGSIPWVGGFISAAASFKTEEGTVAQNELQTKWLEEHEKKIKDLGEALKEIGNRFDSIGEDVFERVSSEGYLSLVKKGFQSWDRADTREKRRYISSLLTNAAGTRLCTDDLLRLFIDWLNLFHEAHFAVIREIYKTPNITRFEIWEKIHGKLPREDSAEADLFRFLIRDLSMGGVIRQARETNHQGQFLRKQAPAKRTGHSSTLESAFEDTKPYELTELGKQFVHYTLNDVVVRLG